MDTLINKPIQSVSNTDSGKVSVSHGLAQQVIELTRQASQAILSIYHADNPDVQFKSDDSPLTAADLAAHHILVDGLISLLADTPVLSEESDTVGYEQRQQWQRYWLIDPLDGTKEFIQRNGEFTVNVALIEYGCPVFGVVTVPLTGVVYWGGRDLGAFKLTEGQNSVASSAPIYSRSIDRQAGSINVVASRRHGEDALARFSDAIQVYFPKMHYQSMGSSLKLCLVAEGLADIYPRFAPTCEWDTAAAHAVVLAAGGLVVDLSGNTLMYNQKESLLNPYFYVLGDSEYPWLPLLQKIQSE